MGLAAQLETSNEDGGYSEIHKENLKMLKFKLPIRILALKYQKIQAFPIIQMTLTSARF